MDKSTKTQRKLYPQICRALDCAFRRTRTCHQGGCVLTEDHVVAVELALNAAQAYVLQVLHDRLKNAGPVTDERRE